jgi:hypothetical protein
MTMEQAERIIVLRDNIERNLRRAARQHKRLLVALRAAGDAQLALHTLNYLDLVAAEFHAEMAEQLAEPDNEEGTI